MLPGGDRAFEVHILLHLLLEPNPVPARDWSFKKEIPKTVILVNVF